MVKILQARLQQYVIHELQVVQLDLAKAEKPEIKLPTFIGSSEKHKSSRKASASALLTMPKPLTLWITTNYGKFFMRWEYQTTWPASWENCMQVKMQQLDLDMEQEIVSKLGKDYIKTVYCHAAYLTYMQNTSCEMPVRMKHKLESRLPGKISITSLGRWHHSYGRKRRGIKKPPDESEREEWKRFKTQHSKN